MEGGENGSGVGDSDFGGGVVAHCVAFSGRSNIG